MPEKNLGKIVIPSAWLLMMMLLFGGAAFILMKFFMDTNRCTVLSGSCGRARAGYCGEWVQTGTQPNEDDYFLVDSERILTCEIAGGRPVESDCDTPVKSDCEQMYNTTI